MEVSNLELLYNPRKDSSPMHVACFMSGSGSNVKKIIEYQKKMELLGKKNYEVALIFTDVEDETKCKAKQIAAENEIDYLSNDITRFYKKMGHENKRDMGLRPLYYREVADSIKKYGIDLIALGGFMSVVTNPILDEYPGRIINVHPADLSIKIDDKRKYTGMHAVTDTILAGEKYIRSSVHIVREMVDYGEILMMSKPIKVELSAGVNLEDLKKLENKELLQKISDENQNTLKEAGDWVIFPKTIEIIAQGRFAIDNRGNVFVDGKFVENGYKLG